MSAGILGPGDRVELLEGEIIEMSPEKSRHAAAVDLALDALRRRLGASHTIRVQHPLAVSETSEPEPDLAVVPGTPRDYEARRVVAARPVAGTSRGADGRGNVRRVARAVRAARVLRRSVRSGLAALYRRLR